MKVLVRGKSKGVNPFLVRQALKHYSNELVENKFITQRLLDTLCLDVVFKNPSEFETNGQAGCTPVPDGPGNPKFFEIEIRNTLRRRGSLIALAHEMIHVKQYAKGELYDYDKLASTRWRDMRIENSRTDAAEFFKPWEIEANGLEYALYRGFYRGFLRKWDKEQK
jgi:hypothetical protein